MTARRAPLVLHASAAAWNGQGVLILGPAGSGKSSLSLAIMGLGGRLVSDDRTCLGRRGADLIAWAPVTILGRVEARGVGILRADPAPPTPIALVVDLGKPEPERLPPPRNWTQLGWSGPVVHGAERPGLIFAILQYLKAGRADS